MHYEKRDLQSQSSGRTTYDYFNKAISLYKRFCSDKYPNLSKDQFGNEFNDCELRPTANHVTSTSTKECMKQSSYCMSKGRGTLLSGRGWCTDRNKNCPSWAKQGECNKNPRYMHHNCRLSCGTCITKCVDRNKKCPFYQHRPTRGQCWKNPGWMHPNCKRTCNKCDRCSY